LPNLRRNRFPARPFKTLGGLPPGPPVVGSSYPLPAGEPLLHPLFAPVTRLRQLGCRADIASRIRS